MRVRTYLYILVHTVINLFFRLENSCSVQDTIVVVQHKFSERKGSTFPTGSADTADAHGRRGSNVYGVNTWLWMFARGKPESRLGGLSVEETALKKSARHEGQVKRAVESLSGSSIIKMKRACC